MEKFIYTNAQGRSITFAQKGTYIIANYSGLAQSEVIPISSRGYRQIGKTLAHTGLGLRIIQLDFYLHSNTMEEFYEKRRELAQIFNPLLGEGTLIYSNNYTTKSIAVLPTLAPQPINKMGSLQLFSMELTAHNPLWYDVEDNRVRMAGFENGLTYPLEKEWYRFADISSSMVITNVGDWTTPVKFEFSGSASNPTIANATTGEQIAVNKAMENGEQLIIDTAFGNKTVMFVDGSGKATSAYNLISNDTTFFQLALGDNRLVFAAETGQPEVYITWRNCYVGV